jgi:hypothetical protein
MGQRRGTTSGFRATNAQPVQGVLRLSIVLLILITAGPACKAQEPLLNRRYDDRDRTETQRGAVTLADNSPLDAVSYGIPQRNIRSFSSADLQHRAFATVLEKHYPRHPRREMDHDRFWAAPASGFPEIAQFEQAAFGEEITPVAEPGTVAAALLAAGSLLFRSRKFLSRFYASNCAPRIRTAIL